MCYTQILDLRVNKIGDPGIAALADALGKGALASLERLRLDSNKIGDDGLKALAEACANGALDHLEDLYLGNNNFSQQSKDILETTASKTNCSIHF